MYICMHVLTNDTEFILMELKVWCVGGDTISQINIICLVVSAMEKIRRSKGAERKAVSVLFCSGQVILELQI